MEIDVHIIRALLDYLREARKMEDNDLIKKIKDKLNIHFNLN